MKKLQGNRTKITAALMAVVMLATGCTAVVETPASTLETAYDYSNIRPQDDYYGYINGLELSSADILYDTSDIGGFGSANRIAMDAIQEAFDDLINRYNCGEVFTPGSKEDILINGYLMYLDFYQNGFGEDDEQVRADIVNTANVIMNASSIEELLEIEGNLEADYGICPFLDVKVDDGFHTGLYEAGFETLTSVAGISLEEISQYYNNASHMVNQVVASLSVCGIEGDEATEIARSLAYIAIEIANSTDIDMISKYYTAEWFESLTYIEDDQFNDTFTNINIDRIMAYQGISSNPVGSVTIADYGQLACLDSIMTEENLPALKAWLLTAFIDKFDTYIVEDYPLLQPFITPDDRSPEYAALMTMTQHRFYNDEFSSFYTEIVFTEDRSRELLCICEEVREGYRQKITNCQWLTQETRDKLLQKLDDIVFLTGADIDLTAINTDKTNLQGANFYETYINQNRYMFNNENALLGQPLDRTRIRMNMAEVNACYSPGNTVTITEAILQEPFFSTEYDHYTNLGGIGFTIAHEVGHCFDSNCIGFDLNYCYNPDWICAEDLEALTSRNEVAIEYFESNFPMLGYYYVDGARTLGENYADLGGMEVIMTICTTNEERERVFESYARTWSEIISSGDLLQQLDQDEHSPAIFRVNAILATIPEFYEVYDVAEGDGMYIAPESRIGRWN